MPYLNNGAVHLFYADNSAYTQQIEWKTVCGVNSRAPRLEALGLI